MQHYNYIVEIVIKRFSITQMILSLIDSMAVLSITMRIIYSLSQLAKELLYMRLTWISLKNNTKLIIIDYYIPRKFDYSIFHWVRL